MRFTGKKIKRLIAASLLTGSLILAPEVCEFPFSSVAFTEVKMYMGMAEDYASPIESQDVAKLRAREKAIQRAKEQAGVILQNYSRSINAVLTDDEISTITANTYQMVGEPVYEQTVQKISDTSTVILWKATVKVNVDDNEVKNWLKQSAEEKRTLIRQNKELEHAVEFNDRQVQDLRKRAKIASTEQEQNELKAKFAQADQDFLYSQKIQEANRLRYKGQFNNAASSYSAAIRMNPNKAEAYVLRGEIYGVLGVLSKSDTDKKKAFEDFNKSIELEPNYFEAYLSRGIYYHSLLEQADKALADINKAIQLDPSNAYGYSARGTIYVYALNDFDKALEDLNRAVRLAPDDAYVYVERGGAYEERGDLGLALADYSKAIELNPACYEAYVSRGALYLFALKDKNKSLADYNKCIEINPDSPYMYSARAYLYQMMGNNAQAAEDFAKAEELKKKDATIYAE